MTRIKKRKAGVGRAAGKGAGATASVKRVAGEGKQGAVKGPPREVDEYFAGVPGSARSRLQQIRTAIRSAVPADAVEVISYKIPAFKGKKVLVWYAAFAEHCSLFPTASVIAEFKDELSEYTTSKGTVQFPNGKALPMGLIKKLVKARVAQSERAQHS